MRASATRILRDDLALARKLEQYRFAACPAGRASFVGGWVVRH
jgi:hypothetical protein